MAGEKRVYFWIAGEKQIKISLLFYRASQHNSVYSVKAVPPGHVKNRHLKSYIFR